MGTNGFRDDLRSAKHEDITNKRFSPCIRDAMVKAGPRPVPLPARDESPQSLSCEPACTVSGDHHKNHSRGLIDSADANVTSS
jgi:hypothetical protein